MTTASAHRAPSLAQLHPPGSEDELVFESLELSSFPADIHLLRGDV